MVAYRETRSEMYRIATSKLVCLLYVWPHLIGFCNILAPFHHVFTHTILVIGDQVIVALMQVTIVFNTFLAMLGHVPQIKVDRHIWILREDRVTELGLNGQNEVEAIQKDVLDEHFASYEVKGKFFSLDSHFKYEFFVFTLSINWINKVRQVSRYLVILHSIL